MTQSTLSLPSNVLYSKNQIIELEKIATFIGANGSGKSSILKSIFDAKLSGSDYNELKVVCFSSGQNENYSQGFSKYLNEERAKRNALNLDCFYYDKSWSKILIFLATCTKYNGLVRSFLKKNNYVLESELEEDESTNISFEVKVDRAYTNLVKQTLDDEKKGEQELITNRPYHRTLYNFINTVIYTEDDYNFELPIEQQRIHLTQDLLSRISFEKDEQTVFDSRVMFFTQAADNNYFIVKDSFSLSFSNKKEQLYLEELSDGEYQLLFIFSLIDLFDNPNTLFLLDEADSHLHYRNIDRLWDVFEEIAGKVLTTTHLMDSITKAGIDRLRVVEEGQVKSDIKLQYIASRLKDLSKINNTQFQALSLFTNIVLIDDENDWEIFKLLTIRKIAKNQQEAMIIKQKLSRYIAVKKESSYQSKDEVFGYAKLKYLESFSWYVQGHSYNTKNVFLICDRDELQLASIGTDECNLLVQGSDSKKSFNGGNLKSHLLSWRRREIKHYLISSTALDEDPNELNQYFNLGPKSQLRVGNSGDTDIEGEFNLQLASLSSNLVKDLIESYIEIENEGFCPKKTREYVEKIPKEEISEDIVYMYNYLVGNNE